jgi:hypothetical protein
MYIQFLLVTIMPAIPESPRPVLLEQLLRRDDLWRGHSRRFTAQPSVDTGHASLNGELLHKGWPLGALVEICQRGFQGEWQLFMPALLALHPGLIVLLNPPAEPFSQALLQAGMDLDRLVVINAPDKTRFLACFTELARTSGCGAILGWQPRDHFTYTEVRKCLLAASEGAGLPILFRPSAVQQQSSPAPLRLFSQVVPDGLEVTVFKQKGVLQRYQPRPLVLPLPPAWQGAPPYHVLDRQPHPDQKRGGVPGTDIVDIRESS